MAARESPTLGRDRIANLTHPVLSSRHSAFARHRQNRLLLFLAALGASWWLWSARPARSDNFIFYLPSARQVIPLETLDHTRYLPLLKTLNLVGTVTGLEEKRHSLKLWVGDERLELREGDKKLRVNDQRLELASPVRVSGGQWLVPLDFLYTVLPRVTRQVLEYRAGDPRMFIGDVKPLTFSAHLGLIENGARLTVQFTGPVTVQTAATNGQWVVFLGDKALEPLEPQFRFDNRYLSGMAFDDQDGLPKLILTPGSAGLNFYPKVSPDGRTFEAEVIEAPPQQAQAGSTATPSTPGSGMPPAGTVPSAPGAGGVAGAGQSTPVPTAPPPPPLPVVVLDAGHGGSEAGARGEDGVTERDLVAAIAERARAALAGSGKFRVVLTRTGSGDPTPDERAAMTNLVHPVAFVTLHAGDLGSPSPAAAVYTYAFSSPPANPVAPGTLFLPWGQAQQAHLSRSRDLAGLLVGELAHVPTLATRNPDEAPVFQLRAVDAPAVAVELGTLAPRQPAGSLASAPFQDQVASALARALAAFGQGAP